MSEDQPKTTESEEGQGKSQPETYKVVVGGEESEVKLDELVAGYQRQEDYTQKTQGLADEKKRFDSLIEDRATELYLKALEDGKSTDEATREATREATSEGAEQAVVQKLQALEQKVQASDARIAEKEADNQLGSIIEGLKKEYPKMDEDKVLIQFHNTAKEHDDIGQVFSDLAKKSHEDAVSSRKAIIDEYIADKTKDPFGSGETGHSTAPTSKPTEPVATFEAARERAEKRLEAIRDAR